MAVSHTGSLPGQAQSGQSLTLEPGLLSQAQRFQLRQFVETIRSEPPRQPLMVPSLLLRAVSGEFTSSPQDTFAFPFTLSIKRDAYQQVVIKFAQRAMGEGTATNFGVVKMDVVTK